MKLCSTAIYLEAGYNFSISHKVDKFMIPLLVEKIMIPYKLDQLNPEVFLDLQVTTDSQSSVITIVKPDDIHDGFLTWKMYLPYQRIVEASNYLSEYLDCFFDAASMVFEEYGVDSSKVLSVKKIVKKEVLNNPDYEYIEQYLGEVGDYDFD